MRKKLLLSAISLLLCLFSLTNINAQDDYICYDEEESTEVDFWLDHVYYGICTDWEGTNSKLFEGVGPYIDFNGGSSVDFTGIYVPEDAIYTVQLLYGIGYADENGAVTTVNVNNELAAQLTLFRQSGSSPYLEEFEVELYSNYNNVIQFKQVKDWPLILSIQLVKTTTGISDVKTEDSYTVSGFDGVISIDKLDTGNNSVRIYTLDGKSIFNKVVSVSSLNIPVAPGLYIANINGSATKVLVK